MENKVALQYKGFIETPNLWHGSAVLNLFQFDINPHNYQLSKSENFNEIRLGKRVEQFFCFQINKLPESSLIANNLQIKNKKITIGEIDALLTKHELLFHVEIIYKFYLYDSKIKTVNDLYKWIGPNRKDTLIDKLNKLKNKQLPLLHSENCKSSLSHLDLKIQDIKQSVCFKAQLFTPYKSKISDIAPLNKSCIFGFYISYSKINQLKDYQFHIPKKIDWLVSPHNYVSWMCFSEAAKALEIFITEKQSPMVWLKEDSKLQKCFITFW
mgnify:FL=1